ncbi:hypothetical protein DFJ74DRAFT_142599 [Hyaloraphidium curvatum]|nr:hypothetical protein DFJ74DRAFT_142599 [Hyaloraphidium curvatum]
MRRPWATPMPCGCCSPTRPPRRACLPTAMALAAACAAGKKGSAKCVKLLLNDGRFSPGRTTPEGITPLMLAAALGNDAIVDLRKPLGISKPDALGVTLSMLAAANGHHLVVRHLANNILLWDEANARDVRGWTALYHACARNRIAAVQELVDATYWLAVPGRPGNIRTVYAVDLDIADAEGRMPENANIEGLFHAGLEVAVIVAEARECRAKEAEKEAAKAATSNARGDRQRRRQQIKAGVRPKQRGASRNLRGEGSANGEDEEESASEDRAAASWPSNGSSSRTSSQLGAREEGSRAGSSHAEGDSGDEGVGSDRPTEPGNPSETPAVCTDVWRGRASSTSSDSEAALIEARGSPTADDAAPQAAGDHGEQKVTEGSESLVLVTNGSGSGQKGSASGHAL